jgi:hypothetical protein
MNVFHPVAYQGLHVHGKSVCPPFIIFITFIVLLFILFDNIYKIKPTTATKANLLS